MCRLLWLLRGLTFVRRLFGLIMASFACCSLGHSLKPDGYGQGASISKLMVLRLLLASTYFTAACSASTHCSALAQLT